MGGAERMLYQLVSSTEFEHTVFYFHAGPFVQQLEDLHIKTVQIKGYFFRYDPLFLWRLYHAMRSENPDVIHAMLWAANVAARLCAYFLGKPLITAYHNNVCQDGRFRNFSDRLTFMMSDKHIAVSEQIAQALKVRTKQSTMQHIEIIPNGIDIAAYVSSLTKEDLGLSADTFVIGAVGRFVALKRFDLLFEAVATCNVPRTLIHVLLIGVGPEEKALRKLAEKLGIASQVTFVVGQDARVYYPLFDCFVQSSDKEGISIALLEAMSFGISCIVMGDDYQHPVITHNVDGLVCSPGNKEMLAAYIELLTMHKHEAQSLAHQGFLKVKKFFNSRSMIDKYAKVFNEAAQINPK